MNTKPEHPDTAQSLMNLGSLYRAQGKYKQAEPLFKRALAIYKQVLGPEHPDTAACLGNLASLYFLQEDYTQAEPLMQERPGDPYADAGSWASQYVNQPPQPGRTL